MNIYYGPKVDSVYLDLRDSFTGRIIDSMRVEVCEATKNILQGLRKRHGNSLFVMRDGATSLSTTSKKKFEFLKLNHEADYLYSKRLIKQGSAK